LTKEELREVIKSWADEVWGQKLQDKDIDRRFWAFEHLSKQRLERILKEVDMRCEKFPTPDKIKHIAMESGLWIDSGEFGPPSGCEMCNYTGWVVFEDLETGYEKVAVCTCAKGMWRREKWEEMYNIKLKTISEIEKNGKYRIFWGKTCQGCRHFVLREGDELGYCLMNNVEVKAYNKACDKYQESSLESRIEQRSLHLEERESSTGEDSGEEEFPF